MTTPLNPNVRELAVFLDAANQNQQQIIKQYPELYSLLDELQKSFERMLGIQYEGPGIPALLVLTAHGYFLAGVRLALGGQMPPVYPVLRAGMESVLFGLLMTKDRSKEQIWMQRGTSEAAEKKCRNSFTAKKGLEELFRLDPELHECVDHYYSLAIDSGAHPNVGAVTPHLNVEETGEHWLAQIRCIYPADSQAVFDTLRYTVAVGACMLAMMRYVMSDHPPAEVAYAEAKEIFAALRGVSEHKS